MPRITTLLAEASANVYLDNHSSHTNHDRLCQSRACKLPHFSPQFSLTYSSLQQIWDIAAFLSIQTQCLTYANINNSNQSSPRRAADAETRKAGTLPFLEPRTQEYLAVQYLTWCPGPWPSPWSQRLHCCSNRMFRFRDQKIKIGPV